MVYFRKRLTPEILGEINEMIIQKAETEERSDDEDDNTTPPSNSGTVIVDATCAPSQIKYPQDTELLNEVREINEKDIDELHITGNGKEITQSYRSAAFIYQKKFTEIAKIWHIAQNEKFVFPDRLSAGPRKTKYVIKSKITLMKRSE